MTAASPIRRALMCLAVLCLSLATMVRAFPPGGGDSDEATSASIAFDHAIDGGSVSVSSRSSELEAKALEEMLRGTRGQVQRWAASPELVVLDSVMEYRSGERSEYPATSEMLTDAEVTELIDDLTAALAVLTGNVFERFSAVTRERLSAGGLARVAQPNRIVVGRYRDVQRHLRTIGLGGRASKVDGTITAAAILLDAEFDRTNAARKLLRMHELGHALGYNHVESRISIMNPRIGPEPTDFDRLAASIAFRK